MRVLVAGAAGAIGCPLVAQLVAAGHTVVGTTRRVDRVQALREQGAEPVVCDLLDAEAARSAVLAARPDAIVDQLTSLPRDYDLRRADLFDATNRLRRDGTAHLIAAARDAGVPRYVMQSISFMAAAQGPMVLDETAPLGLDGPIAEGVRILDHNERTIVAATQFTGIALRFGMFYGPGTYYAPDGSIAAQVRARRHPLVGPGAGFTSFIHVADAAAASVAALGVGAPGVYNITDDEPAATRDWLPIYAAAIGAKRPLRIPVWLARLIVGPVADAANSTRGASNAKAKSVLGWAPAIGSWREGFARYLDTDPPLR